VLGAKGALSEEGSVIYDEARIEARSKVISVAIDARAQHYPDGLRFSYAPLAGREAELAFTPENWERIIRDYNLNDLSI
jgi:hypothetical protein